MVVLKAVKNLPAVKNRAGKGKKMSQKIQPGKFTETPEQKRALEHVLAEYGGKADAAVTVLEEIQTIYGYLPEEILKRATVHLKKSLEELYAIGTFYSQFSLYPKGKYNFSVCLGTACYVNGSNDILTRLKTVIGIEEGQSTSDGLFSISSMRCVGCCGLAPVMTVGENVYGRLKQSDVDRIVAEYREKEKGGK